MSFRVISNQVAKIDDLHLPPIVKELTDLPRGLVLVTGHTGSGKSTTLAAMIGLINSRYGKHIITLEDPIEYLFENERCMIEQREIGSDCPNFASGLRHALRQDPDIIMVGEMRDLETTSFTITAAETGHLVLSTLHTINAPQTIERIIDIYPTGQQNQIRTMLANTLQAVISQTLFKRIDQPGMVPCTEDPAVHLGHAQLHPREPDLRDPEHHRDLAAAGHAEHGYQHRGDVLQGLHRPGRSDRAVEQSGKNGEGPGRLRQNQRGVPGGGCRRRITEGTYGNPDSTEI